MANLEVKFKDDDGKTKSGMIINKIDDDGKYLVEYKDQEEEEKVKLKEKELAWHNIFIPDEEGEKTLKVSCNNLTGKEKFNHGVVMSKQRKRKFMIKETKRTPCSVTNRKCSDQNYFCFNCGFGWKKMGHCPNCQGTNIINAKDLTMVDLFRSGLLPPTEEVPTPWEKNFGEKKRQQNKQEEPPIKTGVMRKVSGQVLAVLRGRLSPGIKVKDKYLASSGGGDADDDDTKKKTTRSDKVLTTSNIVEEQELLVEEDAFMVVIEKKKLIELVKQNIIKPMNFLDYITKLFIGVGESLNPETLLSELMGMIEFFTKHTQDEFKKIQEGVEFLTKYYDKITKLASLINEHIGIGDQTWGEDAKTELDPAKFTLRNQSGEAVESAITQEIDNKKFDLNENEESETQPAQISMDGGGEALSQKGNPSVIMRHMLIYIIRKIERMANHSISNDIRDQIANFCIKMYYAMENLRNKGDISAAAKKMLISYGKDHVDPPTERAAAERAAAKQAEAAEREDDEDEDGEDEDEEDEDEVL